MKPAAFYKAWEYFSVQKINESFTGVKISILKLSSGKWNVIADKAWKHTKMR